MTRESLRCHHHRKPGHYRKPPLLLVGVRGSGESGDTPLDGNADAEFAGTTNVVTDLVTAACRLFDGEVVAVRRLPPAQTAVPGVEAEP
jgi:hypothetical protein